MSDAEIPGAEAPGTPGTPGSSAETATASAQRTAPEAAEASSADVPSADDPAAGPTEWGEGQVGVGPWEIEHPGEPRPNGDQWDPELLDTGDRRNVVDRYRYWRREAIVADLDTHRHSFHVAIENFGHDANIGTVVRTANAFLAAEVHIVGRRRWNRRGAMVTDRYQHLRHHEHISALMDWAEAEGLPVVAVDNLPGADPLETVSLPPACILLFGQEGPGVSSDARLRAARTVSIAQFGSTRSINAGVAAGIAMHAWIREHAARP